MATRDSNSNWSADGYMSDPDIPDDADDGVTQARWEAVVRHFDDINKGDLAKVSPPLLDICLQYINSVPPILAQYLRPSRTPISGNKISSMK